MFEIGERLKVERAHGVLAPFILVLGCLLPGVFPASAETSEASDAKSHDRWAKFGVLDVTIHGARPDDEIDDTAALQKAIDEARDKGLVAFFPGGVYVISDTLMAVQPVIFNSKKKRWVHDRRKANALVGSSGSARPVLKLSDNAKGFDNPQRPKPLIWIWSQARDDRAKAGSKRPEDEQPSISFNQVFTGIDIDVSGTGNGNAGAVGIRHAGSQGSTLEDVNISAQGAFAGLYNPPGQGGGTYKLSVEGGRYGVWADHQARYPVLAGVVLKNQAQAAIFWKGQSNLTISGFLIERSLPGPVIALQPGKRAYNRALTMVDGIIRGSGGTAIDNRTGRNLYMQDVYFSGFARLAESAGRPPVESAGAFAKVKQYSYTGKGSRAIFDGAVSDAGIEIVLQDSVDELPSADVLVGRHLWSDPFPSFQDEDVVSIIDFGARPDDNADDTRAIQTALAKHRKVLVPKGTFVVSETLKLGSESHLLGIAKHLSVIQASPKWKSPPGSPVIATEDDASAKTTLSFLLIERPKNLAPTPLVEWRAGRNSVVRDVMGGVSRARSGRSGGAAPKVPGTTYKIRGQGGGRWFGLAAEWNRMSDDTRAPGYRHLAIEGTREPLAMYGLNIERGLSDPQIEITDARNVAIYYLKSETLHRKGGRAGVLQINKSQNIAILGYSGNAKPWKSAIIRGVESDDIVLANVMPIGPDEAYETVVVEEQEKELKINGLYPASVVRLGDPELVP